MVFMRSKPLSSRYSQAFFSIDATFALLTAISMFIMLSAIVFAAGLSAKSQAGEARAENLALRFSSFVLEKTSEGGTIGKDFTSINEISRGRFDSFFSENDISGTGASFARIRLVDAGGGLISEKINGAGAPAILHCVPRLALLDGEMVRLEACIS